MLCMDLSTAISTAIDIIGDTTVVESLDVESLESLLDVNILMPWEEAEIESLHMLASL